MHGMCLRCSLSPSRFSVVQDSETTHLLAMHFITTGLADPWSVTRVTFRKRPRGTPNPLELYSEAYGLRPTHPDAPVLPCIPRASQHAQQPAARHKLYRHRHPLGGVGYPHSHGQDHRGISSSRPCPCRPNFHRWDWGRSGHFRPQRPVTAGRA